MKLNKGLNFLFIIFILIVDICPSVAEPLLLFIDRHNLRSYDLDTKVSKILLVSGFTNAIAMDCDHAKQKLYVSDVTIKRLYVVDLSASLPEVDVLLDEGLNVPDGLAVDWINNNLYWTDTGKFIAHFDSCCNQFAHYNNWLNLL